MTTTKSHPLLDTSNDHFRRIDHEMGNQILAQIGRNIYAISGGRYVATMTGLVMPVVYGYAVTVDLDGNDTYVVRRLFTRAGKTFLHGERTNVYAEELSEVAYMASCFRSYDADEWPGKA
jgi:hypothetical protein